MEFEESYLFGVAEIHEKNDELEKKFAPSMKEYIKETHDITSDHIFGESVSDLQNQLESECNEIYELFQSLAYFAVEKTSPEDQSKIQSSIAKIYTETHYSYVRGVFDKIDIIFAKSLKTEIQKQKRSLKEQRIHLDKFFEENIDCPYPTDKQKQELAEISDLSLKQVNSYFYNKRQRLKVKKQDKSSEKSKFTLEVKQKIEVKQLVQDLKKESDDIDSISTDTIHFPLTGVSLNFDQEK